MEQEKEIKETLQAAKLYLSNLTNLNSEIISAEQQVEATFVETERNIAETFSNLKDTLLLTLNKREIELQAQARKIKHEGVLPLQQCRNVIQDKISSTRHLLEIGDAILGDFDNKANLSKFDTKSALLGSLPEVPELKEVPYISFQHDDSSEQMLQNICTEFGEISRIAPFQISQISQRPGALLVEWHCVENDDKIVADIQAFYLQRVFGDVLEEKYLVVNFKNCYKGVENQFLVKDCQPNKSYSFRVSCQFDGISTYSPWSLPQVSRTTLQPFSWQKVDGYSFSNDNQVVKPIDVNGVLFSDGPQLLVGYSIEFTFLEVDSKSDCIIGISMRTALKNLKSSAECEGYSFTLDRSGRISVDGVDKSTVLPEFTKGLKVCFTCEKVTESKVRIHIDSNEKRVTYDWNVDANAKFYFAAQFFSTNWKILVE